MKKNGQKIQRKLLHLRFRPIRVFCFHQVSDVFDETTMYRIDWLQTDVFKDVIEKLRLEGYRFISLPEAYEKLKNDSYRFRKYAVLTADDGWASLRNILPWLNDQQIPVTLFLNPAYFDGKHYRERDTEKYLTWDEVNALHEHYPLLTIGSHGWDHTDVTRISKDEFTQRIVESIEVLSKYPNYIPFYAFPYGRFSHISILHRLGVIPLLVEGNVNYTLVNETIDREVLGRTK